MSAPGTSQPSLLIGLTGGIASGKTAVSDCFADHDAAVVDTDVIARDVVAPGMPAYLEIVRHFGQDIVLPDGNLNRAELRHRVFADSTERQALEQITHPRIRDQAFEQVRRARAEYLILVVPLLLKSPLQSMVNRILVVDVPRHTQLERLLARDGTDIATAHAIIAAQSTREERLLAADDVIENNGSLANTRSQVARLDRLYRRLAAEQPED